MPGNVDLILFLTGFAVGAGSVAALGHSLLEDHDRRRVIPATVVSAVVFGLLVGWCLMYFAHWAKTPQSL